jgi:N-formylglutamate amidohydrolase
MSATELRHRIRLLEVALAAADDTGLLAYDHYRRTLEEELARCRTAFVEAVVSEIASLRAAISGPLVG